jgi:hypothetical protein
VISNRDLRHPHDQARHRVETIFERAVTRYHGDELHGGARWVGDRVLDELLMPIARDAFLDADDLPADEEILEILRDGTMQLLGEGYHVTTLVEPARRFVLKYAKQPGPVPPLGPPGAPQQEWEKDHAVRPDGSLHAAVWQHIRAFETYGPLAVVSRVYIADTACEALSTPERRSLERFRAAGIVRSLGPEPRPIRVAYPDDFPREKRPADRLTLAVVVVQPLVTPLSSAIERHFRAGDIEAARDLEARYHDFTQQLWRCGVPHLDFSMLNIGLVGSGRAERLQIFDPHVGVIDIADDQREVRDPLGDPAPWERPVESILRSSRDGSRWALWRAHQEVEASGDAPAEGAEGASALVRDFHAASEGIEEGGGSFGFELFGRTWRRHGTHIVNTVMHAQLWALLSHPIGELVRSVLDPQTPDSTYDRTVAVLGMHDDRPLEQLRAGLKVYEGRPLIVVAHVADEGSKLVKHWGRVRMPAELDVQDDPAIHYHLRDLFTGEMYVRSGNDLLRRGFVAGLAPNELHVLLVEDVGVAEMAVERTLAVDRDIAPFLEDCTKRVGVVGDVHGELHALEEILVALGFIDAAGHWRGRDGTLVLTGDVGHGRHLQQVFDFIHDLAAQAHAVGGRIVWTLGNHDLYVDREGGQGGEDSLGYRLWPTIREAALHPERHPGLVVQAAYFAHGKLFVHGGVMPNIVDLALRERGARDAETVAAYVNDALRRTLVERSRISARDLPHEIFRIGTSHARERRMPGETGYEPAGVFTPDLRELDHYRFHAELLPQVVGHTASARGEIRYSPGSWLDRTYIAIDVGRQHGTGNGGLLLTDFGWVAVTPGGPARLVEVTPLFVELAREVAGGAREAQGEAHVSRMLNTYFQLAGPARGTRAEIRETLFGDFGPRQIAALERFLSMIQETGRCAVVTDLGERLTAFSRGPFEEDSLDVIASFLGAGGVLVLDTDSTFEWLYARLLGPLVVKLGPRSTLLTRLVVSLSRGRSACVFEDGAYRLLPAPPADGQSGTFGLLTRLSEESRRPELVGIDRIATAYVADSGRRGGIDGPVAAVPLLVDVGEAMLEAAGKPMTRGHRGHQRAMDVIVAATGALREAGSDAPRPDAESDASRPDPEDVGEAVPWTFKRPHFASGRRLRVQVGSRGFVHAGVVGTSGAWDPVYNVPLVPVPDGQYEAVLPSGVNAFTFFWTEAPWTPGNPGHWERSRTGPRVFTARGE